MDMKKKSLEEIKLPFSLHTRATLNAKPHNKISMVPTAYPRTEE